MLSLTPKDNANINVTDHVVLDRKLGRMLVDEGEISLSAMETAMGNADLRCGAPGWRWVKHGVLAEDAWAEKIASLFGLSSAHINDFTVDTTLIEQIPEELARRYGFLTLMRAGNEVYVAVSDPTALDAFDLISNKLRAPLRLVVVPPTQIEHAHARYYMVHDVSDIEHVKGNELEELSVAEIQQLKNGGEDGQIVELVDRLLVHAITLKASDIHIEPNAQTLRIRFRVDGCLRPGPTYPSALSPWVASRIKVLANLDIAERFVPQDGRVRTRKGGKEIDLRISSLPVQYGEKVVVRLLGTQKVGSGLQDLGMQPAILLSFRKLLRRPHGMLLVTGPTGSGKSTTLYSALRERATEDVNVVTVEDPIEYEMKGINQVPVNPKRGTTFARALRAILRQDPDVILVGEIRDHETGLTAAEAAVTGHLLLSTLHTNDAPSAVHRLLEMGVPKHLVAPALDGVLAQRLVRRVCGECVTRYQPTSAELDDLVPGIDPRDIWLSAARGCGRCDNTGYQGRFAIHELLVVDDPIRTLIGQGGTTVQLREQAMSSGMRDLRAAALERVFSGETTVQEFHRVITG